MTIRNKLILAFICVLITSCLEDKSSAPFPYLEEINSTREEVGLKTIDSTFTFFGNKSESTFTKVGDVYADKKLWLKSRKTDEKSNKPYFWQKHIDLDTKTGKLIGETDIYRSGVVKNGFEMKVYESLSFNYFYDNFENRDGSIYRNGDREYIYKGVDTLKFTSSNKPKSNITYFENVTKKLNKKEADSILKLWKLYSFKNPLIN